MNSYRQQYSFRNDPTLRMKTMQGELAFLQRQNRLLELDRRYGMDSYRDDYRRSYRDDMYSGIPTRYEIENSFNSKYIRGLRNMPNVLPLSPSNYDMIGRGYQFDSQFSYPSFSSPILGDGTIDFLAQPSILNS